MLRLNQTNPLNARSAVVAATGLVMAALLAISAVPSDAVAQDGEPTPTPMVIEGPQPSTVEDLLQSVRDGWKVEKASDRQRESDFKNARSEQGRLLQEAQAKETRAEARSQSRSLLGRLFNKQKESTRTIAVLHLLDGMTLEEVAREVDMSVSGVRKRLRALRASVRELEGVA